MTQLKSAFRRPDSQEDQIEDNVYDNEEAPKDISIAIKISDQLILRLNSTASRQEMLSNHVDPRAPLPPSSIISQWIQYHENIIPDQYRMRKISETPVLVSYTSEKVISFSPPQWLLQRRYELRFSEAVRGFDHKLRTYNTIPSESLVFSHCINGNVPGLVEMFQAKTASPFDIDTNGNTLLHYTAQFVRLDACRFLIAQGVHGNVRHAANPGCSASKLSKAISKNRESPLHLLARSIGKLTSNGRQCFYEELGIKARNGPITTDEIRDLLRLLIDHGQCDPLSVDKYGYTVFSTYRGPTELFSWLRRQEALQINTGQPDDPGTAALFNVAGGSYSNAPYLARVLLPHGKIDKSIARYTRSDGYTILHALCWRSRDYWLAPFPFTSSRSTKSKKSFVPKMAADEGGKEAWFEMMSDAVRLEADVHACCRLWRELCTPLDYIIGGFSRYEPFDHSTARTAQTAVRHWLQLLEDSGKDLIEYGSEEVRLRAVNREIGHSWDRYPGWEIQSFNFGKHAMDFKIEWREPQVILETALSEFWRSIEAQDRMETVHVRPIPGTWID